MIKNSNTLKIVLYSPLMTSIGDVSLQNIEILFTIKIFTLLANDK